ncbi:Receptor-like cytosolic serine/threonine-protein kinase RBK2, partial [Cucurbita argyrosperma subsp. sororia]
MENDTIRKACASSWENGRCLDEEAKRSPLYMATFGKYKMRSNMLPSASARDLRCFDLESEQRDALSPRGVLEASLQSSEFDHDSSHDSYPESEVQCSQSLSHWKKFFKSWKKRSFRRLASFPPLGVLKISRRGNRSEQDNPGLSDLYKFKSSLGNFTFSELQTATNKFSQANLIGKGGYAEVYKGRLQNGQLIAVKKLNRGAPDERTACFLSELGIIAHIDHPNTAKLIGCCIDRGMHLICDFGLAKWLPKQWTHYSVSKFEGTFGYFAPEYFMHGIVDEKTDVYSFGVLLLELLTGRRALDELCQSLVLWAKPLLDTNNPEEVIDPALIKSYDLEEVERVILTASLCIEQSPILRPRMSQVVILLRGDKYVAECEKNTRVSLQRTYSEELLDAQEYNKTRYLSDLKKHRQLALGC